MPAQGSHLVNYYVARPSATGLFPLEHVGQQGLALCIPNMQVICGDPISIRGTLVQYVDKVGRDFWRDLDLFDDLVEECEHAILDVEIRVFASVSQNST